MEKLSVLLTDKRVWAAVFTLVVILVQAFIPTFQLDVEHTVALVVVVAGYIVGVTRDPGLPGWAGVLQSRKFITAVIQLILVFLDAFHVVLPESLTPEGLISIVLVLSTLTATFAFDKQPGTNQPGIVDQFAMMRAMAGEPKYHPGTPDLTVEQDPPAAPPS